MQQLDLVAQVVAVRFLILDEAVFHAHLLVEPDRRAIAAADREAEGQVRKTDTSLAFRGG
jgi:hypothetical protein